MIDQYDIYKRLQEINTFLKQVENQGRIPKSPMGNDYMKEIGEEMGEIMKKRHLLNAAGTTCPRCGGTGRA